MFLDFVTIACFSFTSLIAFRACFQAKEYRKDVRKDDLWSLMIAFFVSLIFTFAFGASPR